MDEDLPSGSSLAMSLGKEITMTVPYSERTGYGFLIDGSRKPLRISLVERGSMSQEAGLVSGDLLLKVNGHDVREAILQTVQSIISYSTGSPLTLKIARPQEREAEGKSTQSSSLKAYQAAVGDAMRSAQDAFDLLGLSPSKRGEREEKEVAISLEAHASDSDQTLPSSSQSEDEELSEDPIMDFTRGADEYAHESHGHFSAAMVGGVIRAQQALQGIKDLSSSAKPKTQGKPQVSSEASIDIVKRAPKVQEVQAPPPPARGHSMNQSDVRIEVNSKAFVKEERSPSLPISSLSHLPPQPRSSLPTSNLSHETPSPRSVTSQVTTLSSSFPPSLPPPSLPPPSLPPPSLPPPSLPPSSLPPQPPSHDLPSPSHPPPIPPYNPSVPDSFLLSNRPEYQLQVKRQLHSYEDVSIDSKPAPPQPEAQPTPTPASGVVLRSKGKGGAKKVDEGEDVLVPPPPLSLVVMDSPLDPVKASDGLPASVHTWKASHVLTWLHQLNPKLSDLYNHCFTQHSITGHTLLHLNQSKLQYIGIESKEHRSLLGMAVARLRLHHEQKELERLTGQVSWL